MYSKKCAVQTDVLAAIYEEELLTVPAADNAIRLLPPLTISDEDLAEAVNRLDKAAEKVSAK